MSHRKPSKTYFKDDWRDEALCQPVVQSEPSLATAWDNIFVDWNEDYVVDPRAEIASQICEGCPVRRACLSDALNDNMAEGIRAGYRFSLGTVSQSDARGIYKEYGLRAKVRKKNVVADEAETEEM